MTYTTKLDKSFDTPKYCLTGVLKHYRGRGRLMSIVSKNSSGREVVFHTYNGMDREFIKWLSLREGQRIKIYFEIREFYLDVDNIIRILNSPQVQGRILNYKVLG